ncbi:MAG: dephospho-CoA kinase [Phycisphaeraceae bacterium]
MKNHKPIIGLAGGIGSGKSTVARVMAQLGGLVIDADAAAREALKRPDVREQITTWWGRGMCDAEGCVDRQRLAERVFTDPAERRRLEGLLHPLIAAERERLIAEAEDDPSVRFVVLDAPLLFEVGLDERCDETVFVNASEGRRLERVVKHRGWTAEEMKRREKNQMPLDRKRQLADNVIVNDASEAECVEQVRRLLARILGNNQPNA